MSTSGQPGPAQLITPRDTFRRVKPPRTNDQNVIRTLTGSDASRRVGFALYYAERDKNEKLLRSNAKLEDMLAELLALIADNEALQVLDPEGPLVRRARSLLAAMRLRPRGQQALERIRPRVS